MILSHLVVLITAAGLLGEQPLVQILVVVANIQVRALKTEVEKGSMVTAVGHGSVDPKR